MNASALDTWLSQLQDAIAGLEEVLQDEAAALRTPGRDPSPIDAAAQRKQELVAAIDGLVRQSNSWLAQRGFAAGSAGLEAWLDELAASEPGAAALRSRWEAAKTASARCRELNEINGLQIALLRRQVQAALSVLLGDGGEATYGRDGASQTAAGSQTSYKA